MELPILAPVFINYEFYGELIPTMEIRFKDQIRDAAGTTPVQKVAEAPGWNVNDLPEKGSPASNYRYATPTRTNDVANWLATDGPSNESELDDLCDAVVNRKKVGEYSAINVVKEWEGCETTRIMIKAPCRALIIVPKWIAELARALTKIKDNNGYRKVPKKSRPLFE
jgi:hypothetical protein